MKKLIVLLSFISLNLFAAKDCIGEAVDVAKMNLDQKAISNGFETSNLEIIPLDILRAEKPSESILYKFVGNIYKASYVVNVSLDSSCGVDAVVIEKQL